MASIYDNQIKNRNFLSPTGFKFVLNRAPKVSFFGNEANIPDLNLGIAEQPTYLKDIPLPGDKVTFGDFNLRFLVDENLENYNEISNWIRSVGYAETLQDAFDFQNANADLEQPDKSQLNFYSDGTLQILTSAENPNFKIVFQNLFPTTLSTLTFDATAEDINYFTADVSFKYTIFNITDLSGNKL